jgi:aspartate/methionine/tyrosine aminotransferase
MSSEYSTRSQDIKPFMAMDVLARANQLESQGCDVIHLEVGQPDFVTPAAIIAAGKQALDLNQTGYSNADGLYELRQAISAFYASDYNLDINVDRIFVTAGGSGALCLLSALLTDVGQGWILSDPGYPSNRNFVTAFSGDPQLVTVTAETRFQLSARAIARHWQENTKVVLVGSPSNPTGTAIRLAELKAIYQVIKDRGGFLVSDEIYQGLEYGPDARCSALAVADDVFVVNSFSKYFAMTGWRIGWLVAPESAREPLMKLSQNLFICPSVPAQHAALAAFSRESRLEIETNRLELARRKSFMLSALRQLGFKISSDPDGAFYLYAELPEQFKDAKAYCSSLLEASYVGLTPGDDFGGDQQKRFVRISYAQKYARLVEAVERIEKFNS